jgi:hypothetical protein
MLAVKRALALAAATATLYAPLLVTQIERRQAPAARFRAWLERLAR